MGPQPGIALMKAINARDWERAEQIAADLRWAGESLRGVLTSPEVFASYNIQVERLRMEASGYCEPGPIRPPYNCTPADIEEASRECGRRYATLREKYAAVTA